MQEVSLYIHIPFCAKKCMYCDFPSFCGKENLMMDYARALSKEISISAQDKLIKTIFIGGGTPTYLSLSAWKVIGDEIKKINKKADIEFSVECNPGTISLEKLNYFKEIGINRLSIGLQAWQDELLNALGRIHTLDEFLAGYKMARNCGFNNINIDIMFGLPSQTLDNLVETLYKAIALQPEHISCYSLIVEEGTPFYKLYEKGTLNLPDEEVERDMYQKAVEILEGKGYKQYEISNFSKTGYECRHNLVYWELEDYIGCGAASHSYVKNTRYRNEENIEKYIKEINSRGCAVVEQGENSEKDTMEEFMFMGLRKTSGISEQNFEDRFKKSMDSIYSEVIKRHIKDQLLIRKDGRIFLSKKGIELSNHVMSDFIL
jgi:oxygen-independent coproporphyrinogen-3 oxidase